MLLLPTRPLYERSPEPCTAAATTTTTGIHAASSSILTYILLTDFIPTRHPVPSERKGRRKV